MSLQPYQFSVRTLLAATTVACVCCSLLVWNKIAGAVGLLAASVWLAVTVSRSRQHFLQILGLAAGVLVVVTTANSGSFQSDLITTAGLPFPWLSHDVWDLGSNEKGFSAVYSVVYINWLALTYAATSAASVAAIMHICWRLLVGRFPEFTTRLARISLAVVGGSAFACAAVAADSKLASTFVLLPVLLLMLLILATAAWGNRSYPVAMIAAVVAALCSWWGMRFGARFNSAAVWHQLEWQSELAVVAVWFGILLLASFPATFVARRRAHRLGSQGLSTSTGSLGDQPN